MDYNYLKAFLYVAKFNGFSAAALKLNIAQSAVSRQVALLEDSLKKQLLIRSSRKVILTPEGQALFAQLSTFDDWLEKFSDHEQKELRIGALQGVVENWLVNKISDFPIKNLPNLSVSILTDEAIVEKLNQGLLDIGITSRKLESDLVTSRPLIKEEFYLISKNLISLSSINEQRWISGTAGKYIRQLSKSESGEYIKVNSIAAILRLVEKGIGVAVVAGHLIPDSYKGHRQKVKVKQENLYLCIANYKYLNPKIRSFINSLNT